MIFVIFAAVISLVVLYFWKNAPQQSPTTNIEADNSQTSTEIPVETKDTIGPEIILLSKTSLNIGPYTTLCQTKYPLEVKLNEPGKVMYGKDELTYDAKSESYKKQILLEQGKSKITITATDSLQNVTEQDFTITALCRISIDGFKSVHPWCLQTATIYCSNMDNNTYACKDSYMKSHPCQYP